MQVCDAVTRQSCWPYLYLSLTFPEKWCDSELGFPQGNGASEGLGYRARDNPETKPQEALWIMHKQHGASGFLSRIGLPYETHTHLIPRGAKGQEVKAFGAKVTATGTPQVNRHVRNHFLAYLYYTLTGQIDASAVSDRATLTTV